MSALPRTSDAGMPRTNSGTVVVWDILTRAFHWSFAACFAGAWLTAESERFRDVHVNLGYTMLGLIVFRVLWGLVGPKHARFANFVRGPAAVLKYLRSLLGPRPEHHLGHNPAGAIAIVLLLVLGLASIASGWAIYNDLGGEWLEESHEFLAGAMLAAVGVHLAGVAISSLLHRENLVGAMLTGRKNAPGRRP
ncbi:MAG TPA: cytochrome b/b6 domain-containing protein [Usitatibacteraceae bacterium]|nr:cytochrome b/b6 domain-containing protein [Usitatibacteraceae bacterium]